MKKQAVNGSAPSFHYQIFGICRRLLDRLAQGRHGCHCGSRGMVAIKISG
jgi:hypothetical protein